MSRYLQPKHLAEARARELITTLIRDYPEIESYRRWAEGTVLEQPFTEDELRWFRGPAREGVRQ